MLTGIRIGLVFGCFVFALILLKGDLLTGIFSTDAEVVQNGFAYLKGFSPRNDPDRCFVQHDRLFQRQ